ncbi:hypothetical protein QQP08_007936 [Theobroma cacao]|nr:hypothetical protein QQP08_007936 [Theobroma cacao]
MNRRTRSLARHSLTGTEPFLKYLKPGALARLRDSRISARSHRISSLFQISPSSPPSSGGQTFSASIDGFPCFAATARVYGPRCGSSAPGLMAGLLLKCSAIDISSMFFGFVGYNVRSVFA